MPGRGISLDNFSLQTVLVRFLMLTSIHEYFFQVRQKSVLKASRCKLLMFYSYSFPSVKMRVLSSELQDPSASLARKDREQWTDKKKAYRERQINLKEIEASTSMQNMIVVMLFIHTCSKQNLGKK